MELLSALDDWKRSREGESPVEHHHENQHHPEARQNSHTWKWALVVILALAAMTIYVLTQDESLVPGGASTKAAPSTAPLQP
jgi:hypothetical protein